MVIVEVESASAWDSKRKSINWQEEKNAREWLDFAEWIHYQ